VSCWSKVLVITAVENGIGRWLGFEQYQCDIWCYDAGECGYMVIFLSTGVFVVRLAVSILLV
jgi:hypothetical protein